MGTEILEQCLSEIGCDGNEGAGMVQGLEIGLLDMKGLYDTGDGRARTTLEM